MCNQQAMAVWLYYSLNVLKLTFIARVEVYYLSVNNCSIRQQYYASITMQQYYGYILR